MKNFKTCICILGLSGIASADVLMDQIGDMDGTGIGGTVLVNQDFTDAGFDVYDTSVLSDFVGDGGTIDQVEMVMYGYLDGWTDPSAITGYRVNLYSSIDAACDPGSPLVGDIATQFIDAADATFNPDWAAPFGSYLVTLDTELASSVGTQYFGMMVEMPYGSPGAFVGVITQPTINGEADTVVNPGLGFNDVCAEPAANIDEIPVDVCYRLTSGGGSADPCDQDLPAVCNADVDGDGSVAVSDVLEVIASWGQSGDGTYRPTGDCAPMPNGDCTVDVADILEVIGQWGSDCSVYGGCCFGDGTCDTVTADDCAAGGGNYFGDNSDCASGSCNAGACCVGTAQCSDVTEDACDGLGGTYRGDGTDCASIDCSVIEPGDNCEVAIEVTDGDNAFDTTNMTAGTDLPTCAEDSGAFGWTAPTPDIWFMWTASESTDYDISTCDLASFDTSLVVYEGDCSNQVACNGDAEADGACQQYHSALVLSATAGETYYIRIGGWSDAEFGAGTLSIAVRPPPAPGACCLAAGTCLDNLDSEQCAAFGGTAFPETTCADGVCDPQGGDECADAVVASVGENPFDTTLATPSEDAPTDELCSGTYLSWGESNDIWMVWTPDQNGTATFSACDSGSYDTSMALYEGSCDNLVACNGDGSGETGCQAFYSSIADFPVTAGESYYVRMGGYTDVGGVSDAGPGTVTITFVPVGAIGACCFADGTCADTESDDCSTLGGAWNSQGDCSTFTCPQPLTCDGSGYTPMPTDGDWTAGTSDVGAGYLRAADCSGQSGTLTVWGLELLYDAATGWGSCPGSVDSMVVTTYDSAWNVLSETSIAANGIDTGNLYGPYTLYEYQTGILVDNAAYVGVASESAGDGECWSLWINAEDVTAASFINNTADGLGWVAEEFGLGYCLD